MKEHIFKFEYSIKISIVFVCLFVYTAVFGARPTFSSDIEGIAITDTINKYPAARRHVRMVEVLGVPRAVSYVSKLKKMIELNFSHGNGHLEGKNIITNYWDVLNTDRYYGENGVPAFAVTRKIRDDGTAAARTGDVTAADITGKNLIISNNISSTHQLPSSIRMAIENAVKNEGLGYLGFHGSGDNAGTSWNFYATKLQPTGYNGHGDRHADAPIYPALASIKHVVLEDVFRLGTPGLVSVSVKDIDADGLPVDRSDVLAREVRQEWYRYPRNVEETVTDTDIQVLLKYDARAIPVGTLALGFQFANGNPFNWVLTIGNGRASYLPPGHTYQDDLIDPMRGRDGTVPTNDYMRYIGQLIFFLSNYDTEGFCSTMNDCSNLKLVTEEGLFVYGDDDRELVCNSNTCLNVVSSTLAPVALSQTLRFNSSNLAVEIGEGQNYQIKIYNASGQIVDQLNGSSTNTFNYTPTKALSNGVYFLSVALNGQKAQVKRYAVLN